MPRVSNHQAMERAATVRTTHAGAWEVFMRAALDNACSALRFRACAVEFRI
ncbi:hypothetical protein ACVILL_003841 [Bradyrhizobium sp. USDA 3364]